MTATDQATSEGIATQVLGAVEEGEHKALEAVRKFVDTVDDSVPKLIDGEDDPRRKIIDSAFKMVEQLMTVSNDFAQNLAKVSESAMERDRSKGPDD